MPLGVERMRDSGFTALSAPGGTFSLDAQLLLCIVTHMEQKYRMLEVGEVIQDGDEVWLVSDADDRDVPSQLLGASLA